MHQTTYRCNTEWIRNTGLLITSGVPNKQGRIISE